MKKITALFCFAAMAVLLGCAKEAPSEPSSSCAYAFGYNENDDNNSWSGEYLLSYGFTMASDVTVSKIAIKLETATDFVAGIYTDNSGSPETRLSQSAITAGRAGWNTVAITPADLTASSKYWIVFCTQTTSARGNNANTGAVCKYDDYLWSDIVSGSGLPASYNAWQIDNADGDIKIYALTCN
jgi:hypothetical protein